jgi:tetratricopeptide (TPR) repeat protein
MVPMTGKTRAIGLTAALVGLSDPVAAETAAERCATGAVHADVAACEEALAANPDDVELRRFLAISLTQAARYVESIAAFREVVTRRPDDWKAHFDLANGLGYIRRYAEAVDPIEAAIRLGPKEITVYQAATVIYSRLRRYDDAMKITRRAADLGDPVSMYDMYRFNRYCFGTIADEPKAFEWLSRAAESGHITAMDELAEVHTMGLLGRAVDTRTADTWKMRRQQAIAAE